MRQADTHWVVALHRRNRSLFFAFLLAGLIPYLLDAQAGPMTWCLLVVHMLVYPQLVYMHSSRAGDPLDAEMRSLPLDGFLFGLWIAYWGFPVWISFAMVLSVAQNVVIFQGMAALWRAFLASCAGAIAGLLVFGLDFRPDTPVVTTIACMLALAGYMLMCANYAYLRGISLRESRRRLGERLLQITELQSQLEDQAHRDALTGVFNRRHLDQTLAKALDDARASDTPLALLLLDIDFFKRINDQFGHQAGDEVICELARQLSAQFTRAGERVYRYGGEEFLVMLPGTGLNGAVGMADQLRSAFASAPFTFSGESCPVTLSAGVAIFPQHGDEPAMLVRLADLALYAAKEAGRNRTCAARSPEISCTAIQPDDAVPTADTSGQVLQPTGPRKSFGPLIALPASLP